MALSKAENFQAEAKKLQHHIPVFAYRERFTVASVNNGAIATLLPAVSGYKYKLIDAYMIAVGGVTAGGTSLKITGKQAAATVDLLVGLLAGLTRSTVLRAGATNANVLADGASFTDLDVNTAVQVTAVGTFTGVTHFDVHVEYTLEKA